MITTSATSSSRLGWRLPGFGRSTVDTLGGVGESPVCGNGRLHGGQLHGAFPRKPNALGSEDRPKQDQRGRQRRRGVDDDAARLGRPRHASTCNSRDPTHLLHPRGSPCLHLRSERTGAIALRTHRSSARFRLAPGGSGFLGRHGLRLLYPMIALGPLMPMRVILEQDRHSTPPRIT